MVFYDLSSGALVFAMLTLSQAHKMLALAPPPTVTEVTRPIQVALPTLESESAEHIFFLSC